ncbi:Cytochrome oxidase assembly [Mucor velutinosus]|uniref:Cytochrome oxidase assembly n=1 Tax=Mucor velutinosus TaxID=708070 RepID=A0AAN7D751_9FUNG|nr:Cytochrome oxidase assembly [Mucor velutinosus]
MKESLCAHRQNSIKKRHLIGLISLFSKRHEEACVSSCSTATITSISSSSTICNNTTINHQRPIIRAKHRSTIPDYTALRKLFLKFQSKPKHRRNLLKEQVSHWFRKNSNDIYFPQLQAAVSFWGIKDAAKEERKLDFGRFILMKWWRSLLNNISIASQDDKGLYFEFILEIMTRNEFLEFDFLGPSQYTEWLQLQEHVLVRDYRRLLVASLRLAIEKLNQKAIYSNIIAFSAKVLAICYFKIPGVAISLLRALDSPLKMIHSVHKEMTEHCQQKQHHRQQQRMFVSDIQYIFPSFLHTIMTSDKKSYQHCLLDDVDYNQLPLRKSGNWIRRWTSDDSELFFLFYRYYHATLKVYMTARYPNLPQLRLYQRNLLLSVSPGYLCLASYFASKLHLLTQREICSVTNGGIGTNNNSKSNFFTASTLSPTDNIQLINEPATTGHVKTMFTSSIIGKPKPLIMATRRYTECMAWNTVAADPDGLFHDMVNVWLRAVIKKTVLTNSEQVFCLFDILEQTVLELQKYPVQLAYFPIDRPFILQTLNIVLSQCDHTITLLRSLSFIYAHFQFLTVHAALLDTLCNGILMNTFILERLLLHWGKNVRIFFLRCLVWRVSRVWSTENVLWSTEIVDEIRGKGDSHFCNGHQCWLRWSSKHCLPQGVDSEELQAYQQCAL